jgi:predicted nuclease with TOPRIM domain
LGHDAAVSTSAAEDRGLRDALEQAQAENKALRAELEVLRPFSPEVLLAQIAKLEGEKAELRARLEMADQVRTTWDLRLQALKRELGIARQEQDRLRTVLENERLAR